MFIGVLISAGVVGVVVLALVMVFRRDLVGVDLSARSLVRLYLYLASLASVMVFAIGVSAAADWAAAATIGPEAVYGRPAFEQPCAAGEKCLDVAQLRTRHAHEVDQRRQEDLLRGVTLIAFGALFWGGHRLARRSFGIAGERTSTLRHAYDVLGTFVFGVATVILLPVGTYLALSVALVPPALDVFRQGFGDALSGGLVAVPVWLVYLLRVTRAANAEVVPAVRATSAAAGRA